MIRPSSSDIMATQQKLLLENPAPYVSATQWAIIDRKKGDCALLEQFGEAFDSRYSNLGLQISEYDV